MKNITIKSFLALISGIVIGILSKWGDVVPVGNIISYFGLISSGIVLWLVIGTILIIKSKNKKEFNIIYSLFMISMLLSYYLFSALVVKYLVPKIIFFWTIMFIISLILGNIIYNKKSTNLFRILFLIASIIFLIFDTIEINGIDLKIIILELLLVIIGLNVISKNIKNYNLKERSNMNKKFKIASILMIIHGAVMEVGTSIFMMPLVLKLGTSNVKQYVFAIDFFKDNIILMMAMGIIFGITRVIGAIGVLKNRMWGFVLAMINCIVTMIVMLFMIPSGIADGIFACSAMILLLMGYYDKKEIKHSIE